MDGRYADGADLGRGGTNGCFQYFYSGGILETKLCGLYRASSR